MCSNGKSRCIHACRSTSTTHLPRTCYIDLVCTCTVPGARPPLAAQGRRRHRELPRVERCPARVDPHRHAARAAASRLQAAASGRTARPAPGLAGSAGPARVDAPRRLPSAATTRRSGGRPAAWSAAARRSGRPWSATSRRPSSRRAAASPRGTKPARGAAGPDGARHRAPQHAGPQRARPRRDGRGGTVGELPHSRDHAQRPDGLGGPAGGRGNSPLPVQPVQPLTTITNIFYIASTLSCTWSSNVLPLTRPPYSLTPVQNPSQPLTTPSQPLPPLTAGGRAAALVCRAAQPVS